MLNAVLDLPQLYQRPSALTIFSVLNDLSLAPPSWDTTARPSAPASTRRKISSEGVPAYLTKIVSSPLFWIESDEEKEQIWELAAKRLSERSGRTGMGDFSRVFKIPLNPNIAEVATPRAASEVEEESEILEVVLHEPALSEDNLGLKTWASSYLLAKRLVTLHSTLPQLGADGQILELGAGTGLVGLSAAVVLKRHVVLTDLEEIVPNLTRNMEANRGAIEKFGGSVESVVLDWSQPEVFASDNPLKTRPANSFPWILAADPLYSPQHPRLLVQTIAHHLSRMKEARVVIELPLREAFGAERQDLRDRLEGMGLRVFEEGEETGFDDWEDKDGERGEVTCWWAVWGWK